MIAYGIMAFLVLFMPINFAVLIINKKAGNQDCFVFLFGEFS